MGSRVDFALAVLNGAIGDHLAGTHNPLALDMQLVDPEPTPHPRIAILVHGLMCNEAIWRQEDGTDYGTALSRDFGYRVARCAISSFVRCNDRCGASCAFRPTRASGIAQ